MSEENGEAWEYEDRAGVDRPYTEFELMLIYHGIDDQEWPLLSGNEQAQRWWNYRTFGKPKNKNQFTKG